MEIFFIHFILYGCTCVRKTRKLVDIWFFISFHDSFCVDLYQNNQPISGWSKTHLVVISQNTLLLMNRMFTKCYLLHEKGMRFCFSGF